MNGNIGNIVIHDALTHSGFHSIISCILATLETTMRAPNRKMKDEDKDGDGDEDEDDPHKLIQQTCDKHGSQRR